MAKGKKYSDASKRFDRDALHGVTESLELVKSLASATFDETIELVVRLGVDPRKADQMVRGTVALPAGTGKDVRIAVFAAGEAATAAREAGAEVTIVKLLGVWNSAKPAPHSASRQPMSTCVGAAGSSASEARPTAMTAMPMALSTPAL